MFIYLLQIAYVLINCINIKMRLLFTLLVIFSIVFSCKSAKCQNQHLSFKHLTVNEGLSVGNGNCIFKDSRGYIWVSTFDGLNRFDGIECAVYKNSKKDSNSINGNVLYNIIEDRNSDLWIGSNEGLNFYDRKRNKFKHFFYLGNKVANKTYSPFYIDEDSNIWLQSAQKIMLFNPNTKQFKEMHEFPTTGNLIISTYPNKLFQKLKSMVVSIKGTNEIYSSYYNESELDVKKINLFSTDNDIKISSLCYDGISQWIGTNKGLYKFENAVLISVPFSKKVKPFSNVLALHADKKNQLWIGTQLEGLILFDKDGKKKTQQFSNSSFNPNSLSGNQVQSIYTDDNANVWVSLWGKGIDYANTEKFTFQHHLNKLETSSAHIDNFIRSIVEVKNNRFWCATLLDGIIVLDENKKIIKNITKGLPATIEYIFKDSKDIIWIATLSGLFTADVKTETITKLHGFEKFPKASQQFNFIIELKDGRMLTSTEAGLFFISMTKGIYSIMPVKAVSNTDVYSTIFQASNSDIYVCKIYKGFGVFFVKGDSLILKKDFFNDVLTAKCFTEVKDSLIWIGTTKGLIKFNKNNLTISKVFVTADGLKNQYIYSALYSNNDLWLSTNGGISKLNTETNSIKNYAVNDGLQSNEFNTYSFCKATNGELLFGGVNGINSFYPLQITKTEFIPSVVLQTIRINDTIPNSFQNPSELSNLRLQYNNNTISFQFAVIDYTNPEGCSMLYKLDGYDKDWITATNKSIIRYANLPSGKYELKVKAVNTDGVINKETTSILIFIATPWFKSWWFIMLIILTIAFLLWYFIRSYYKRKLEKEKSILDKQNAIEQERTRLARELHDGLGSMLSGIKHSFSAIKNNISLNEKQTIHFDNSIEKLNTSIKEIRNLSHSMMDSDSLLRDGLINALKDYCRNINNPSVLEILFEAIGVDNLLLKEEQAFHILRITQELIQNIIKHAKATNVVVQIHCNMDKLYLTVEDNGLGFDNSKISVKKGIGFRNIQARLKIINGSIDIQSAIDKGTSIYIQCPVYLKA
jgi:ligand-binding sensor domain-containing protein/two-component sensor histidine kinase